MRILDRYLLKTFLTPWLCCLLGFSFLLIIVDVTDQIQDFIEAGARPVHLIEYYARFLPTIWIYIGPVTLLLGTLYTFYQLTRNNEIIAMRASGISLHRILLPFLVVGVLLSLISLYVADNISPRNLAWIEQFTRRIKNPNSRTLTRLIFRNPEARRTWAIGIFHTDEGRLENVNIWQFRDDSDFLRYHLHAESAVWMDSHWYFQNVTLQPHSEEGHRIGLPETHAIRPMIEMTESPELILRETYENTHKTTRELREHVRTRSNLSPKTRAAILTELNIRSAHAWMCLVTILLAAPFATQTARKGVFTGVMLCLGLFFSMFFLMNLFKALGLGEKISPFAAGWTPTLLFGALGLYLLRKLR